MERRSAVRYGLSFPVLFGWHGGPEGGHQGGGFSKDVSTGGIYVACDRECPPLNTEITIEVLIPSPANESVALKLSAQGKVVRLGNSTEGTGFGVRANFSLDAFPF